MKMRRLISPIVVFVLAQLAWFALLALWIYWYVRNYMIFIEVGEKVSPQFVLETKTIAILVGGILLLMAVAVALALIFGRLNQQLKVNRMYDSFIASVTHELKSPLASIQLYLETLSAREVPKERQDDFVALMLKDSQRLSSLISSILEIAGIEERKKIYSLQKYDADTLVRELITEALDQFNLSGDSARVVGYADCVCRVDRRAMKTVLNNLIDNAIKYTVGPPQIDIRIKPEANRLVIQVTDQGIGIAEKDQRYLFKKFRRIAPADSPNVKGTGLGLYWAREIIRHHHGKISVYSAGRNRGTTFTIELPAITGEAIREDDIE
ncbi:MAG: HAMP domain-containing histidine kinase [Spirochaetales bacterium]|nr:HAMP domain-containing histidine kinase [Spirochaetales bacterium]